MESPGHLKMEMAIFQPPPTTHTPTFLYINYPEHLRVGRLAEERRKVILKSVGRRRAGGGALMGVQQEDSEENFTQNLPTQHADTHTVTHCPPKHTLEHFCFLFKLFQCHKNSKQEKEKELS